MSATQQLRRIGTASLASIALNGVLLAIDFSIDPRQDRLSTAQRVAAALLRPAEVLAEHLAPGHGGIQILVGVVSSVVLYTVLAWALLTLRAWRRTRA